MSIEVCFKEHGVVYEIFNGEIASDEGVRLKKGSTRVIGGEILYVEDAYLNENFIFTHYTWKRINPAVPGSELSKFLEVIRLVGEL